MAIFNKKFRVTKDITNYDCNIYSTLTEINSPAHYLKLGLTDLGTGYVPLGNADDAKASPFQVTIGTTQYRALTEFNSGAVEGNTTLNTNTQYTFTVPDKVYCFRFTGNGVLTNSVNNIDEVGWSSPSSGVYASYIFCLPGITRSIYASGSGTFTLEWGDSINQIFFNALATCDNETSDYPENGALATYETIEVIINSWGYEAEGAPLRYVSESGLSFADFRTIPTY